MASELLTDMQVEAEIERLTHSEAVKVARAEQRAKYRRRQYLYNLRRLEKRGNELIKDGVTAESFAGDEIEELN